jgi:hypothetical protein
MNPLISSLYFYANIFAAQQKEYKDKAEECRRLYKESKKYPRKKKKKIRKKLKEDYSFYISMTSLF